MPYSVSVAGRQIVLQDSEADGFDMAALIATDRILRGVPSFEVVAVVQDTRSRKTKRVKVKRSSQEVSAC